MAGLGDGDEAQHNCICPHGASLALTSDVEGKAALEDDQDLATHHDCADGDENPVLGQALEDVEAVVQSAVARKKESDIVLVQARAICNKG